MCDVCVMYDETGGWLVTFFSIYVFESMYAYLLDYSTETSLLTPTKGKIAQITKTTNLTFHEKRETKRTTYVPEREREGGRRESWLLFVGCCWLFVGIHEQKISKWRGMTTRKL